MLRIENCRPGVEVIAIKNKPSYKSSRKDLSIGMIYTIRSVTDNAIQSPSNRPSGAPAISLEETGYSCDGIWWSYTLDQFKLRNIEELISLFDLRNIPQTILDERFETC